MDIETPTLQPTLAVLQDIEAANYSVEVADKEVRRLETELLKWQGGREVSGEHLLLLSLWFNISHRQGTPPHELIAKIGEDKVASMLRPSWTERLGSFSDRQLLEVFSFLNLVLLHMHLEVFGQWARQTFAQEMWRHLSKLYLKNLFATYPKFIREYEALPKATPSPTCPSRMLPRVLELFGHKFSSLSFDVVPSEVKVCEKLLEFICLCLSTSQARLPTLMLLQDRQFHLKNSLFLRYLQVKWADDKTVAERLTNLGELLRLMKRFVHYDVLGESRVARRTLLVHYDTFQEFQRLLFHHFADKVEHYVVKAVGNTDTREKMAEIFSYLTEADLRLLANKLNIFVPEEDSADPVLQILTELKGYKVIVEEVLISKLKARVAYLQQAKSLPLYPTEQDLWSFQTNQWARQEGRLDYCESFAVDRLTNNFTNLEDYLFRHLTLWRGLFAFHTRKLLEAAVPRLLPVFDSSTGRVCEFRGWTPSTLELKAFTVYEVGKAKIGNTASDHILAEVDYSTVDVSAICKRQWESLQIHDTLFLLSFVQQPLADLFTPPGLALVRGCELVAHLDEERNKIHSNEFRRKAEIKPKGTKRHLQVHLDPNQHALDLASTNQFVRDGAYSVVLKRPPHAPLYRAYLRVVLRFLEQGLDLSPWVESVLVGKPPASTSSSPSPTATDPLARCRLPGVLLVTGPPGTGKSTLVSNVVRQALLSPEERILVVTRSEAEATRILGLLGEAPAVSEDLVMRLSDGMGGGGTFAGPDYSRAGRVDFILRKRLQLLAEAEGVAAELGLSLHSHLTCETAEIFFQSQVVSRWEEYLSGRARDYPFLHLLRRTAPATEAVSRESAEEHYRSVERLFGELRETRVMELLRQEKERAKYLLNYHCRVLVLTAAHLFAIFEELLAAKFTVGTLVLPEAGELLDFEAFAALAVCKELKTAVFLSDGCQTPPSLGCRVLEDCAHLGQSMFARLQHLGYPSLSLAAQGGSRAAIVALYAWKYPGLHHLPPALLDTLERPVPGLQLPVQFVDVDSFEVVTDDAALACRGSLRQPRGSRVGGSSIYIPRPQRSALPAYSLAYHHPVSG